MKFKTILTKNLLASLLGGILTSFYNIGVWDTIYLHTEMEKAITFLPINFFILSFVTGFVFVFVPIMIIDGLLLHNNN